MNVTQEEVITSGTEVMPTQPITITRHITRRAKGLVKKVDNEIADVEFEIPNKPKVCQSCGWSSGLSVCATTGEVECMRTGCGRTHGFEKVTAPVPLNLLEPYTTYIANTEKVEWQKKLEENQQAQSTHLAYGRKRGWID